MKTRLKDRIAGIDHRVKIFFIYFYMAGIAFFFGIFGLSLGFWELGIIVGVLNSFVSEPLVDNIKFANKAEDVKEIVKFRMAKNLLMSILICFFITWLNITIAEHWFRFYLEPVSFGLLYATIHLLVVKVFSVFISVKKHS